MKSKLSTIAIWLLHILSVAISILMAASFIMPWWIAWLSGSSGMGTIKIYAYGLELEATMELVIQYLARDITPLYQAVMAWGFLSLCIIAIVGSTWFKDRRGPLFLGGAGISFLAYALVAVFVVIANRTAELNIPLQGATSISDGTSNVNVRTWLGTGPFLAYIAAGSCIVLASTWWDILTHRSNRNNLK